MPAIDTQILGDEITPLLLTLKDGYKHPSGKTYLYIWGVTGLQEIDTVQFIVVGGFGDEILVQVSEIRYAQPMMHRPEPNDTILICSSDFTDIGEGLDSEDN